MEFYENKMLCRYLAERVTTIFDYGTQFILSLLYEYNYTLPIITLFGNDIIIGMLNYSHENKYVGLIGNTSGLIYRILYTNKENQFLPTRNGLLYTYCTTLNLPDIT